MIPESLKEITQALPRTLREDVEGYVSSVDDKRNDIAREAGLKLGPDLRSRFLFAVGVRRIWTIVNGSYWMLDNSLDRLSQYNVYQIQMGSTYYRRGTEATRELEELHEDLGSLFAELGMYELVEITSLPDLMAASL